MTPQELHRMLADDALAVCRYLLPSGVRKGREWCAGSVAGEEGNSLSVRISGDKTGIWSDFATGDGGDLLDLWGAVRGTRFVDTLKDVREYLGVEEMPKFREKKYKLPEKPKCTRPTSKQEKWWSDNGITPSTVTKLKVGEQNNAIVFPYLSPEGVLELVKYRSLDEKKFWSNGDPIPCLFGWQAVGPDVRDIVICEGEKDCLTFWQQGIPALSVPRGAGSGGKQDWIEYEYHRLERFDWIYLCMDSDAAGQEAITEILDRLGSHRCKVMDLTYGGTTYKDAAEAHQDGLDLTIIKNAAQTIDPEELRKLSEFHDDIMGELDPDKKAEAGVKLPWRKSWDSVRLRESEVTVWAGVNSHGKSVLLSNVMVDAVSQGSKWCVASMEMPAKKLGAKIYQQVGGVSFPAKGHADKIKQFVDETIYLFTAYGTAKAERILKVFEYARRRYGVTHFVIDSLAKCGFAEDDYNGQKGFVDELFDYALKNRIHVHLVLHMRKGESEEKPLGKFDVKGTGAITDMVSNVFLVWRNKKKERLLKSDDPNEVEEAKNQSDTLLICCKQRETGEEPAFGLWFRPSSCQFIERSNAEPKRYIDG